MKKNKNAKIILVLSAVLVAVMLAGCVQEISEVETPSPTPQVTPPSPMPTSKGTPSTQSVPSTGMEVNLSISNAPALNETAELTCIITSISDAYNTTAQITLPEGLVLVSGNLSWAGDIIVPEEEKRKYPRPPLGSPEWEKYEYPKGKAEFSALVKSVEVGNWTIAATAGYDVFTQEGVRYGRLGDSDYVYLAVREDTAWISETLFTTEGPAPARQLNGNETPRGTPEIIIYPEEYIIYQDYLKTIGGKTRISDIGTIEATIISVTRTEVCPDEIDFASEPTEPIECSIEPYPKDLGIVRIDRITNYTPYSEQITEPIIEQLEQPSEENPSEEGDTTPGYEGPGYSPKHKPPIEYEPLQEGQKVKTLFLLTVSPAKIRYAPMNESVGGMESIQLPEGDTQQTVSHQVGPEKKIFKPIPQEGDYFVFTTKIGNFPGIIEKNLPGLEVGSKFRAGIWYDGSLLYIEEYVVIK